MSLWTINKLINIAFSYIFAIKNKILKRKIFFLFMINDLKKK